MLLDVQTPILPSCDNITGKFSYFKSQMKLITEKQILENFHNCKESL